MSKEIMSGYYDVVLPLNDDVNECTILEFLEPEKEFECSSKGAKIKSIPQSMAMQSVFQHSSVGDTIVSINNVVVQNEDFGAIVAEIVATSESNFKSGPIADLLAITFLKVTHGRKAERNCKQEFKDFQDDNFLNIGSIPIEIAMETSKLSSTSPTSVSMTGYAISEDMLTFEFVQNCNCEAQLKELEYVLHCKCLTRFSSLHRFTQHKMHILKSQSELPLQQSPQLQFAKTMNESKVSSIYMTPGMSITGQLSTQKKSSKTMALRLNEEFEESGCQRQLVESTQLDLDQTEISLFSTYTCIDRLCPDELKQKVLLLRKDVKLARTCIEELMSQNDEMIDVIHVLEDQGTNKPDSGDNINEELIRLQSDIISLNETIKLMSDQISQSSTKVSKEQEKVKLSVSKNLQLKAENRRLTCEIGRLRKELSLCKKVTSEFNTSVCHQISPKAKEEPCTAFLSIQYPSTRRKNLRFKRYTSLSPLRNQNKSSMNGHWFLSQVETALGTNINIQTLKTEATCSDPSSIEQKWGAKSLQRFPNTIADAPLKYLTPKSRNKNNYYKGESLNDTNKENKNGASISKDFSSLKKVDKFRKKKNKVLNWYHQNRVKLQSP